MNTSSMTLTEVRDRLAELEGWSRCFATGSTKEDGEDGIYWKRKGRMTWDHPVPPTLDEAAKLPEGWYYWINHCSVDRGGGFRETFICEAVRKKLAGRFDRINTEGPTELEARFRLRLACELAAKEVP